MLGSKHHIRTLSSAALAASRGATKTLAPTLRVASLGRRSFWGTWGAQKKDNEKSPQDVLLEVATRDMGSPPGPMLASANPAIRQLGEQYAKTNKGCGSCPEKREGVTFSMNFACPESGFPSHCKEECYKEDVAHHAVAQDLRMIHQDYADLRSGRPFGEFEFPGPPSHDYIRGDLNNWVSFLSDREYKNALGQKIGWARSDEEKFIEARRLC